MSLEIFLEVYINNRNRITVCAKTKKKIKVSVLEKK